jgi:SsrA-binding protein
MEFRRRSQLLGNDVTVVENRKARFHYSIEDTLEAGMMLVGTEVKSLRAGLVNITESYASLEGDGVYLINLHIDPWSGGNQFNHAPRRHRKLLLKQKEINKLFGKLEKQGATLIPLKIYFNKRGIAKVLLGIATGKKQFEKREAIKERDWKRSQARQGED